jgi:thiol-disulfide isomerase/thioredoxin
MRRRDFVGAALGAGVVGAGGWVAVNGTPSLATGGGANGTDGSTGPGGPAGTGGPGEADGSRIDPVTLEVVDPENGAVSEQAIPDAGRPTFVDFFATWCAPCEDQMPVLAEVYAGLDADVQFVSVTPEPVGRTLSKGELLEWWDDHDGAWAIGLDRRAELNERFGVTGYPTAVAVDAEGNHRFTHRGIASADTLRDGIETVLEA